MGYLIDTSIFIAWEREQLSLDTIRDHCADETVGLSVVTVSELLHGVHRSDSAQRRGKRERFVEAILEQLPSFPVDIRVARAHARIWSDLAKSGLRIGAHDLWIAATALVLRWTVATRNLREFQRVPDLQVAQW